MRATIVVFVAQGLDKLPGVMKGGEVVTAQPFVTPIGIETLVRAVRNLMSPTDPRPLFVSGDWNPALEGYA